jgi:4-hydroxybenzoate polyprenyltransferase/phosphoserine phosphatase
MSDSTTTPVAPLFVDLDGTLIHSDLLLESFFSAIKNDKWNLLRFPGWLQESRSRLKHELALRSNVDVTTLPYNLEVLQFLQAEKQRGRHLVLATASNLTLAQAVAQHLAIFDGVIGSSSTVNMKGVQKLALIQEYCAAQQFEGFAYIGDSRADLPIWEQSQECIVVAPSSSLKQQIQQFRNDSQSIGKKYSRLKALLKILRPHQWVKNILLFVPLLMAHNFTREAWIIALMAFASFCICASGVYVANDLLDLSADRKHPHKKRRPFASGALPLLYGPPLTGVLFLLAFGLSLMISLEFAGMLFLYMLITSLYSVWLKRVVLVDVFVLAGLYSMRILAAGVATGIVISPWLASFSFFLFTSLAFAKRYAELARMHDEEGPKQTRGYETSDLELLQTMGPTSGYLAVLVLALYINSQAMKSAYQRDWPLWLICPLLMYWISRVWLHAKRRILAEDPILFVFSDWVSQIIAVCTGCFWIMASWRF